MRTILLMVMLWGQATILLAQQASNEAPAETDLQAQVLAHEQQTKAKPFNWQDITQKPNLVQVSLAPNGAHLAYLRREAHGVSLWWRSLPDGQAKKLLDSGLIHRIHWSQDSRILYLESAHNMAFIELQAAQPRAVLFVKFDAKQGESLYAIDDSEVGHILLRREVKQAGEDPQHQLIRVGLDGSQTVLFSDDKPVFAHLLSDSGGLMFVRQPGDSRHQIMDLRGDEPAVVLTAAVIDQVDLVRFDAKANELWLVGHLNNDLRALHVLNLDTRQSRLVHQDPQQWVDLSSLVVASRSREPLVAHYHSDVSHPYALDPMLQPHVENINSRLTGSVKIEANQNTPHWLVRQFGAQIGPTRYHLYDLEQQRLQPILDEVRGDGLRLTAEQLPSAIPVSYRASDGMLIHGYVMLPTGQDLSNTPLLVHVHGGPFNRVWGGFSPWQYLVNQGYALFLPNFRASKGYGLNYMTAGKAQFATRVQQDIIDGIEYLHRQGVGQAGQVGVFGHSFGGFSVLALLSNYPDYFRAGMASAGPTELLNTLFKLDKKDLNRYDGIPLREALSTLMVDWDDSNQRQQMNDHAPANTWQQIKRPLLIWAGALDQRVPIAQVRDHASRLHAAGHEVELVVDQQTGHNFARSDEVGRQAYRWLVEDFFARHFDRPRPEMDAATERYLAQFRVY